MTAFQCAYWSIIFLEKWLFRSFVHFFRVSGSPGYLEHVILLTLFPKHWDDKSLARAPRLAWKSPSFCFCVKPQWLPITLPVAGAQTQGLLLFWVSAFISTSSSLLAHISIMQFHLNGTRKFKNIFMFDVSIGLFKDFIPSLWVIKIIKVISGCIVVFGS